MLVDMTFGLRFKTDAVFLFCALLGTIFFVLRALSLFLFGYMDDIIGHDLSDGHANSCIDFDSGEYHTSASLFKIFTLHSVSGFFMMFGWVGLACVKQLGYGQITSLGIASFAGTMTLFLTALIFKWAMSLVGVGSRFDINKTVGLVGTVYSKITPNNLGKIQLDVDGVTREILACTLDHSEIVSFKLVKVIQVIDHEIVAVKEIDS